MFKICMVCLSIYRYIIRVQEPLGVTKGATSSEFHECDTPRGAGEQTQALFKSSQCSWLVSQLSSTTNNLYHWDSCLTITWKTVLVLYNLSIVKWKMQISGT